MLHVLLPTFEPARLQVFFFVSNKPRNIANQLDLQQCCEKVAFFVVARFTKPKIKTAQSKIKVFVLIVF